MAQPEHPQVGGGLAERVAEHVGFLVGAADGLGEDQSDCRRDDDAEEVDPGYHLPVADLHGRTHLDPDGDAGQEDHGVGVVLGDELVFPVVLEVNGQAEQDQSQDVGQASGVLGVLVLVHEADVEEAHTDDQQVDPGVGGIDAEEHARPGHVAHGVPEHHLEHEAPHSRAVHEEHRQEDDHEEAHVHRPHGEAHDAAGGRRGGEQHDPVPGVGAGSQDEEAVTHLPVDLQDSLRDLGRDDEGEDHGCSHQGCDPQALMPQLELGAEQEEERRDLVAQELTVPPPDDVFGSILRREAQDGEAGKDADKDCCKQHGYTSLLCHFRIEQYGLRLEW